MTRRTERGTRVNHPVGINQLSLAREEGNLHSD